MAPLQALLDGSLDATLLNTPFRSQVRTWRHCVVCMANAPLLLGMWGSELLRPRCTNCSQQRPHPCSTSVASLQAEAQGVPCIPLVDKVVPYQGGQGCRWHD